MTREKIIERDKKAIEFYKCKMKTASIEDKLWCYEPKIEQLKDNIRLLENNEILLA